MMVDYLGFDVWRFERRYKTRCVSGDRALDRASGHGENGRKSIFSDYIHRDDWFVRTVRRDTWNEAPPKVFGCLNSCQEVVLHVSHLMDLLDSSRRRGVV